MKTSDFWKGLSFGLFITFGSLVLVADYKGVEFTINLLALQVSGQLTAIFLWKLAGDNK